MTEAREDAANAEDDDDILDLDAADEDDDDDEVCMQPYLLPLYDFIPCSLLFHC